MNAGQGSISFGNKVSASGAPFAPGSANNGVSVDSGTGKIVLGDSGGHEADLLNPRFISMPGSFIEFNDAGGVFSRFRPASILMQNNGGTRTISISAANALIFFEDQIVQPVFTFAVASGNNADLTLTNGGTFQIANAAHVPKFFFDTIAGDFQTVGGMAAVTDIVSSAGSLNVNQRVQAGTFVRTGNPGFAQGDWRLGIKRAAAVVLDAANYVEISIGGTIVKLAIVT